jgi:hypothetical protein
VAAPGQQKWSRHFAFRRKSTAQEGDAEARLELVSHIVVRLRSRHEPHFGGGSQTWPLTRWRFMRSVPGGLSIDIFPRRIFANYFVGLSCQRSATLKRKRARRTPAVMRFSLHSPSAGTHRRIQRKELEATFINSATYRAEMEMQLRRRCCLP